MMTRIASGIVMLMVATMALAKHPHDAHSGGSQGLRERGEARQGPVTVLAPFKLAAGKTEVDLLAASERFQKQFVDRRPGVIRRELVRTGNGNYLDIVQFRSAADAEAIMKEEMESDACHAFSSLMDMEGGGASSHVDLYPSLATYNRAGKGRSRRSAP